MRSKHLETVLFDGVLAISDPLERREFLDQTCAGNPELRERLDSLLAVDEASLNFFTLPPATTDAGGSAAFAGDTGLGEAVGTNIGRYRLIERMGEGGCGVVYLAEQQHPVRRKVALKIVRLGMDSENVIARFEMERQSLALMEHPNIASVLDAGATATGRPYFVMELVDGEMVTNFCDHQRLSIRERLELFIQICLAIQHAHQKGVIHRDIKPSNILVRLHDGAAEVKVIDFGIAKAIAGGRERVADFTVRDQFIGTPAYMSPEQAEGSGMDVDTRSDIYSLGVLLYKMLTGRQPFDPKRFKECTVEEIRRILREDVPPIPSAMMASLTAAELKEISVCRGGENESQKLAQKLKGDLDWIVMKAMEKDRQRRYETANGLALDLRRHLDHEPVTASPPGRRYRLGKLVRRNRGAFIVGTLVFMQLAAGLVAASWLFLREKEAHRAVEVARAKESQLRAQAEFREIIAQAAVKIHEGDPAAADKLLAQVPVEEIPVSLEAAISYNTISTWHMGEGRWDQAADRYASLAQTMTRLDPSDSRKVSWYLLPAAAVICYSGDHVRYEIIRRIATKRFAETAHPVVAEHVLKASLLIPADREMLLALEPLSRVVERAIWSEHADYGKSSEMVAWSSFALALIRYRNGDYKQATEWADFCLAVHDRNAARDASVQIFLAMIEYRAGSNDKARALLDAVGPLIRGKFSRRMELVEAGQGVWFDWVNAMIYLKEAEALMGE